MKKLAGVLLALIFAAGCGSSQTNRNDETSFVRLEVISVSAVTSSTSSDAGDASTVVFRAFPFRDGGNPTKTTEFVRLTQYTVDFSGVYPSFSSGMTGFVPADSKDVSVSVMIVLPDAKRRASPGLRPTGQTATVTFEGRDSYDDPVKTVANIPVTVTD